MKNGVEERAKQRRLFLGISGVICLIGVVFVILAVVIPYELHRAREHWVEEFATIDPSSPYYKYWLSNDQPNSPHESLELYLWNMTAVEPKPSYELIGPFEMTLVYQRVDVSFAHGGSEVNSTLASVLLADGDTSKQTVCNVMDRNGQGPLEVVCQDVREWFASLPLIGHETTTLRTGTDSLSKTNEYVAWAGKEVLHVWANQTEVRGNTPRQLEPHMDSDGKHHDTLELWSKNLMRTVQIEKLGKVSLKELELWRYALANDTWDAAPLYFQSEVGLANMTAVMDRPYFWSQPAMVGVDEAIRDAVGGQRTTMAYPFSFVDVEPISGKVLRAQSQLQLNLFGTLQDANLTTYYPVALIQHAFAISSSTATALGEDLYFPDNVSPWLLWPGCTVGTVLVIGSVLAMIYIASPRFRPTLPPTRVQVRDSEELTETEDESTALFQ